MALNYIWIAFFLVAFVMAAGQTIFCGNYGIWSEIMNSTFSTAKQAFEISLGLTGVLSLWLGLMKIGERGGLIALFSRLISPLFSRLFPGIPKGHPAMGSIFMNVSANMLGLDNAATPLGLKAMTQLQELNDKKDTATDAMLMFLILNSTGLTLVPISIMMYRAQCGAANPTDVFIPIMLATSVCTLFGLIMLCIKQRIRVDAVLVAWIAGLVAIIAGMALYFGSLSQEALASQSSFFANVVLFTIVAGFIISGLVKKINVYDAFIEGAKEGFHTAVMILPYCVAILVAIGVFRASGAMELLTSLIKNGVAALGIDTSWVEALPTGLMKPLSGSGSRGLMVDAMNTFGADSFVGRVASCMQGCTLRPRCRRRGHCGRDFLRLSVLLKKDWC